MTLTEINEVLRERIRSTARSAFDIDLDQVALETPPKVQLGDIAFPVAFELAKRIKQATGDKRNPRELADVIKASLEEFAFVSRVEIAGAGYLNVFLDRGRFLASGLSERPTRSQFGGKMCVEHTSVNPNKAAHIGHVRNAVLGDTFQRILSAVGHEVEVQYYIDNTGVQVADVVVGFLYLQELGLEEIRELDARLTRDGSRFDLYCWDLYAQVGQEYESNSELKSRRSEVLQLIEEGGNPTAVVADYIATRNVECLIETMDRLGIRYDLLPRESEILHLHFWQKAFEQMKELGVIHYEKTGKNAGCWVMPFDSHTGTDEHEADKILVRSNGTVTYTGKDIAYQMWKLGLLQSDFFYKPFYRYPNGDEVWVTTADSSEGSGGGKSFGRGEKVFNVIDSRQSYTQEVVRRGVAAISPEHGENASIHLAYEMVALSPSAAEELGFELSDADRSRSFIEMSGRKGLGVKAADMIDRLESGALSEVEARHHEINQDEKLSIARQIAVGALRYFLLKFTRNTVIVFDFKEALSLEGETGVFCQYSAVRANSILRKLEERGETLKDVCAAASDPAKVNEVLNGRAGDEIWSILLLAKRYDEVLAQAAAAGEPATLAKFTFNLAKAFNLFYHNHKILPEPDPVRRAVLLTVADSVRETLRESLSTMGIEVPPMM